MKNILHKMNVASSFILGILALFALLVANMAVFSRFMNIPMPWAEELLRYIFIWLMFICTAFSYHDDQLISITMLELFLKERSEIAYKLTKSVQFVLAIFFAGLCCVTATGMMRDQLAYGEISPAMEFPMYLVTLGVTIGCLMWTICAVVKLVVLFTPKKTAQI